MAGFPYHALDSYLPKLIRAGERIAICDQLEAPKRTNSNGKSPQGESGQEQQVKEDRTPSQSRGLFR
jgi:DNA mismatch repair ATPase MutS